MHYQDTGLTLAGCVKSTEEVRTIPLQGGYVAIVDAADYDRVAGYHWYATVRRNGRVYVRRTDRSTGVYRKVYLHQEILGALPGFEIDHRDRDGLNNRRSNLRQATRSANRANSKKYDRGDRTSQYKGVSWVPKLRKWRALAGGQYIGYFGDEEEAARAYDRLAFAKWGPFARLNFPDAAA